MHDVSPNFTLNIRALEGAKTSVLSGNLAKVGVLLRFYAVLKRLEALEL